MGSVLARGAGVARTAVGSVLDRTSAAEPEGNALGADSPGSGGVSADRPGQRMEAASRLVRQQRHGRSPGRRFWPGRSAQALRLSRPAAGAQGCIVFASGRALAGSVQRQFRRVALRSDQYLFRDRRRGPAGRRQTPARLQPRSPAGLPASGDRLVGTPEGLPLAYEVLPGNTKDDQTLRPFLAKIELQYGKARRVWLMDHGIPTEAGLAEMRQSDPPVRYLGGTPKGRLTQFEKRLLDQPWQEARKGVQVKLLAQDGEFYVFAESADRVLKERAMRRRQLKWVWRRLKELAAMKNTREQLLMKLGAARAKAPVGWRLVDVKVDKAWAGFTFALNRNKLRTIRRREGRYLLRTNLTESDPATLWQ